MQRHTLQVRSQVHGATELGVPPRCGRGPGACDVGVGHRYLWCVDGGQGSGTRRRKPRRLRGCWRRLAPDAGAGCRQLGAARVRVCVSEAALTHDLKCTHVCHPAAWRSGVWMGVGAPSGVRRAVGLLETPGLSLAWPFQPPRAPASSLAPPSRPSASWCLPPSPASLRTSLRARPARCDDPCGDPVDPGGSLRASPSSVFCAADHAPMLLGLASRDLLGEPLPSR